MDQFKGYVAFLDVLGFSNLVGKENHQTDLASYIECVEQATQQIGATPDVKCVLFSDSIVLSIADNKDESLLTMLQSCSKLFHMLLAKGIPVRGAIAYGSFLRRDTSNGVFVAGRAIIDAYRFEQQQDWVGIMLAPSVILSFPPIMQLCKINPVNHLENLQGLRQRLPWMLVVQESYNIPFHNVDILLPTNYNGFAIVPTEGNIGCIGRVVDSLEECWRKLGQLRLVAPDPPAQKKYQQTQEWLSLITQRWRDALPHERFVEALKTGD